MFFNGKERAHVLGEYIVSTGATVRAAAQTFEISKSTVYSDVTARLRESDRALFEQVRLVLEKNKAERHLRGGLATKARWNHAHDPAPGTLPGDCKNSKKS